ncbi:MAG TPA: F0F1 ATP synthase subunit epsilon [Myxococcota bacterium]|nr:F0F1 ATP synthase subunit epsilon [Myxococcota bacterium]
MMRLNVVTPERAFLTTEATSVTLPNKMGEMQALEGHIACLVELKSGVIRYEDAGRKILSFMVGPGFAEITAHEINVMCEIALLREEVNKERELALQRDLEEKLKKISDADLEQQKKLLVELERSVASISLLE